MRPLLVLLALAACTPVAVTPVTRDIPAGLQGRWGLTAADCIPGRADAKGLMIVGPTTLRFYESLGTLGALGERSETRIAGSFAFTGEGQTWQRQIVLDASEGPDRLVRTESGADIPAASYRYTRC
jgi:hypothetical protein